MFGGFIDDFQIVVNGVLNQVVVLVILYVVVEVFCYDFGVVQYLCEVQGGIFVGV